MKNIECPNCGSMNKSSNIKCDSCGAILNELNELNEKNKEETVKFIKVFFVVIFIIIILPELLFGLVMTGYGFSSIIKDNNQIKGYVQTTAVLVGEEHCEYDQDVGRVCSPIYEYTINGVDYKTSSNSLSNDFKEKIVVYYNPEKPSEYYLETKRDFNLATLIIGLFLLSFSSVPVIIYVVIKKIIIKNIKKNEEIVN